MLKQFFAILWRFLFLFLCSSFLIVFNWGVLFSFLLRKKVRVSLGYLFCIWSMSGACACFSALSCIYIFLSCIIFHYIFYFRTVLLCIFWKIFFRMLSGFCCFCFMLLYKIRKTFGYVFLGYCCRFLRTLLLFSLDAAVVFSGCRYLFSGDCRRFLRFLPFLFHAFVQKLLEFVQNRIFFVQKAERISACFFSFFRIYFIRTSNFFAFFLDYSQ